MAIRTKTVEYVHDCTTTSVTSNTRSTFSSITLTLPETGTRTFLSVMLEVHARGNNTVLASVTQSTLGIVLGAASTNDAITSYATDSPGGECQHFRFTRDCTSYFTSNFGSGTTQTFAASVIVTGIATINISAKILITYSYDDTDPSANTRVKTVKIPIEGNTGLLTASLVELGTNQVPILTGGSGILPEASITVKDLWFEVFAPNAAVATTSFNLNLALDAEAAASFGTLPLTQNAALWEYVIWHRPSITTTSTHAFKASSSTASRFAMLGAVMCVTYTYDHSSTTSVMNSIELPLHAEQGSLGGTTSADQSRMQAQFFIEEPGTITLAQSGVFCSWNMHDNALMTVLVAAGSQTARTYTATLPSQVAGQQSLTQRVDSGSAQGAGVSIARGLNTFTLNVYSSTSASDTTGSGFGSILYLNYTSSLHASGDGVHNHTTRWLISPMAQFDGTMTMGIASGGQPNISESAYWVNWVGYDSFFMNGGIMAVCYEAEVLSGEGKGDGWQDLRVFISRVPNHFNYYSVPISCYFTPTDPLFRRHPADPNTTRLDPEGVRKYRYTSIGSQNTGDGGYIDLEMLVTYHAIGISCTRTVSGYTGTGASLTVNLYRDDTKEWLYQATTISGGNYTFTAFDNTINLFAEVYQDSTHVGRSAPFIAS